MHDSTPVSCILNLVSCILYPVSFQLTSNLSKADLTDPKGKDSTTFCICFFISSLQRLPMLPSCVWLTLGVYEKLLN